MKTLRYLFLAVCAQLFSTVLQAESTPSFWKVTSADKQSTVWLLGSMHVGNSSFYPLPQEVYLAFEQSPVLVVEVDLMNVDQAETQKLVHRYGILADGRQLQEVLKPAGWQQMIELSKKLNFSPQDMQAMKPWFAMMNLDLLAFQHLGFYQQWGVDLHFLSRRDTKKVISIETMEDQLGLFGQLSEEEEIWLFQESVPVLQDYQNSIPPMIDAWKQGDVEALHEIMVKDMDMNHPVGKKFYDMVFTHRNKTMADAVKQFLMAGDTAFVVVGAGHLVGEGSVVDLLRQSGYRVEVVLYL